MKLSSGFHKILLFTLGLVSSYATSYGMGTACIIPTIAAGGLCCFYKNQHSPTHTLPHKLPQPLNMKSFSDNQQSTDSNYESPDSIFESVLTRKNSNPKVLDLVDMGAEPSHK
jgi:hypothetical protein